MKSNKNLIIFLFIIALLLALDLRATLKISYFYQSSLNAILTEYNKGLQEFINSNNPEDIRSSIRIAEQINISEPESLDGLTITNILFKRQNQKCIDYIKILLDFSREIYINPSNKNIIIEIYENNEKIINLTSEVKSNGIIKTLNLQKEINFTIDKSFVDIADYIRGQK
ncbi:MAG: hypothetical protein N2486_01495 [Caloramator sp.]|nr:hypothetical protein [Caloramator sp.]